MTVDVTALVAAIHDRARPLVLAVTGGGSGAISALLAVPGASRTVLQGLVPYADAALIEFLGARPEQFCSDRTARAMAMAAFETARRLRSGDPHVAGVGCTASLASDREKRGPHRLHLAVQTADTTTSFSLELLKGHRTRAEEEALTTGCILNEIAACCGLEERLAVPTLPGETAQRRSKQAPQAWQDLFARTVPKIVVGPQTHPAAVFPGAFNPLHAGHRQMAALGAQRLGCPVAFEISVTNVDKPPLDYLELDERLGQFADDETVVLSCAPTFVEKAALFPGATFLVGTDTLERIAEPRYYGNNFPSMLRAVEQISLAGCRFLVFGRALGGDFKSLDDLNLPPSLALLCEEVPEHEFRQDISSTQLRQASAGSAGGG